MRFSAEEPLRQFLLSLAHKKFMRKSRPFISLQSARGPAQSKTLRVFQESIVPRTASWTAAALRRFSPRHIKPCPCSFPIYCSVEPAARTNRRAAPTLQPNSFPNIAKPEARGVKQA